MNLRRNAASRVKARGIAAALGLALASLACSLASSGNPSLGTLAPAAQAASTTGSLEAEATSPISVQLTWKPVDGASQYRVEMSVGDVPPLTVANLPGSVTSFEDFPAPSNAELVYRVRAVTSAGTSEVGAATLTTPEEVANPLTVKVNYEQNRFVPPTYDPNNPNVPPSTFMPPGFDIQNPDLSLLQPGPKTVHKEIGAEGGTLEAIGASGVKYTLTVPAGAVAFTIPFGLTPVESIEGLPLSGGLVGAVRLEPEGIEFTYPLVLEISPPVDASLLAEGQVAMGFAVSPQTEGGEFYFLPMLKEPTASMGQGRGGHLASPMRAPAPAGSLGNVRLTVVDGKVVGVDRGTPAEVRNTVKSHPPSSSKNRTTSKVAAEQEEQLARLPQEEEALAPLPDREVYRLEREAAKAGSTDEFMQTLTDFQAYLDAGGKANVDGIWSEILVKTKAMFELQKGRCFTRDGFMAAGVAARMGFADEGTFWSQFRDRYVQKYGQESLDDALAFAQRCKLVLTIDSKMTYGIAAVTITYDVTIKVEPLLMRYESDPKAANYGPYLRGYALVYPNKVEVKAQGCQQVVLQPLPTEFIRIAIRPVFADTGSLSNFKVLDFGGGGSRMKLSAKCDSTFNSALLVGGGMWGGVFVDARRGNVDFTGFGVSSPPPSSGVIAVKGFPEPGAAGPISGATITEVTTFKLVVGE